MEEANTGAMAGMEQHPDIMALRARYEQAAATPLAQFAHGLVFLTGLYLAISPWVVGFSTLRSMAVNNLITGVALAIVGVGLASAYGRTHSIAWVAPVVGVWTIITPWVIAGPIVRVATTATMANNVATGAVALCVGAAAMSIAILSKGGRQPRSARRVAASPRVDVGQAERVRDALDAFIRQAKG
jgi:hypothetical protein